MANRYTYTIDENNAVSIFDTEYPNEDGLANIFQPGHPISVNEPWESVEVATAWAEETIENLINPPPAPEQPEPPASPEPGPEVIL